MNWFLHPDTVPLKIVVMLLAILLFALIMGLVLLLVDRPKAPRWVPVVGYLGPALILIIAGLFIPGVQTIFASFKDPSGSAWIGGANYAKIFTDPQYLIVLRNTLFWVILVPLVSTIVGLVYAFLVDRTRFEKLAKTLIFLPMAISMVGAGIIWKLVYEAKPAGSPQIGLMNQVVVAFGGQPQQFLLNPPSNTFFLIVVLIWIQAGFAMTVLSASIKAIPDEIVEAAKVDGVEGWKLFTRITIPSVRPSLIVVLTTIALATMKSFDVVYTMTGGNFQTSVIANEFYTQTFTQNNTGMGAALAVILFVLILPIVIYNVHSMKISEGER